MNSKFDNLEKCTHERLLQINKNIRTLRRAKSYSKEALDELKQQRTETDKLLSMVKHVKQTSDGDSGYEALKQNFIQAKIS